ncbi:MAG: Ig-like domain-containing protein, partial [Halobacteriota archaeon]
LTFNPTNGDILVTWTAYNTLYCAVRHNNSWSSAFPVYSTSFEDSFEHAISSQLTDPNGTFLVNTLDSSYHLLTLMVATATATQRTATNLTLTASNSTPAVNQQVTFNATLSNGTTPLSGENVTIYHYIGTSTTRYNDTTNTTNTTGQITVTTSFGSTGQRTYYATFAGDSSYQASTSIVVTVNVTNVTKTPTALTLTPSTTTPAVNQPVTFNATLTSSGTPLPSESVTIYHYLNNVRYNDTTNTTNATGQISVTTSFGSPGTRTYYATFAGDSTYLTSTSTVVTITVQ